MSDRWILAVDGEFSAAHYLDAHDGKCREMHGHTYLVRAEYSSRALHDRGPARGMVIDFAIVRQSLSRAIGRLDHKLLNALLENPTAEELSRCLFWELRTLDGGEMLESVQVWEGPKASVRYYGGLVKGI